MAENGRKQVDLEPAVHKRLMLYKVEHGLSTLNDAVKDLLDAKGGERRG